MAGSTRNQPFWLASAHTYLLLLQTEGLVMRLKSLRHVMFLAEIDLETGQGKCRPAVGRNDNCTRLLLQLESRTGSDATITVCHGRLDVLV